MRTKIRLAGLLLVLLSGISFTVKAQSYTLTNNLHCRVVLFYEQRDITCGTSSSGPITLNPGSSMTVNINPNIAGGCLIIQQIGGAPAPSNHLWITMNPLYAPCHNLTPYGQSGTTATCGTYAVTLTPNSWTIN